MTQSLWDWDFNESKLKQFKNTRLLLPCRCARGTQRAKVIYTHLCFFLLLFTSFLQAAEIIPPAPKNHFNDYAGVVSQSVEQQLDSRLADFERETSSQIVVGVFPKMESDSSMEDYATRVYNAWEVGLKNTNNGAVLFVFTQDRKMRIQTGYGLEGALPDAICKRIIEDEIAPHFKTGNFDAGLSAGVDSMIKAARGEYKGTGRTVGEGNFRPGDERSFFWVWLIVIIFIFFILPRWGRRGRAYGRRGGYWVPTSGWGGGGGRGGFSGGGFSGGGGRSGGGGASGGW